MINCILQNSGCVYNGWGDKFITISVGGIQRQMAYSELIKDINRIREYMRQLYIFGFRKRSEYKGKSARSYDNEKRRVESWMSDYMAFRREPEGKICFISVDTRNISRNPLFNAFRAKSFTSNDITLHFYILDILEEESRLTVSEIADRIADDYLHMFDGDRNIDESTIRKKLSEYEKLGLVIKERHGRNVLYTKNDDKVDPECWKTAVAFFSETDPVGVIGSYILDRLSDVPDVFSFKHHYILYALDSDIMCSLLTAIHESREATIKLFSRRKKTVLEHSIVPLKIYISTQDGRSYVLASEQPEGQYNMYRIDNIRSVSIGKNADDIGALIEGCAGFERYLWNTSNSKKGSTERLSMVLRIEQGDEHIIRRLKREGRHGIVTDEGEGRWRYETEVYDPSEMLPWIRTFIGRIESIECTDAGIIERFYEDMEMMYDMYDIDGGADNAVQ